MAETGYFVKGDVTSGTGSGTAASPWNINDVCTYSNPKSLGANDIVWCMHDPTDRSGTKFTATTNLTSWVSTNGKGGIASADLSGNRTTSRAIIDAGSVGGYLWSIKHPYFQMSNLELTKGANANLHVWYTGGCCKVFDCTFSNAPGSGAGILIDTGVGPAHIARCLLKDNHGFGIQVSNSTYGPVTIYGCFFDSNLKEGVYLGGTSYARVLYNVFVMPSQSNQCAIGDYGPTSYSEKSFNTVYYQPTNGYTGTPVAILVGANDVIYGNIVKGGYRPIGGTATAKIIAANVSHGSAVTDFLSSTAAIQESMQVIDPQFSDAANGDFTVGADLSGILWNESIAGESAHLIPGAIQ